MGFLSKKTRWENRSGGIAARAKGLLLRSGLFRLLRLLRFLCLLRHSVLFVCGGGGLGEAGYTPYN